MPPRRPNPRRVLLGTLVAAIHRPLLAAFATLALLVAGAPPSIGWAQGSADVGNVGDTPSELGAREARISVPSFPGRAGVPASVVEEFMGAFRAAVAGRTRLEVLPGALITPGIAGSLEAELTDLIADLDDARYALSGELRPDPGSGGYLVSAVLVDVRDGRSSDLLAVPFAEAELIEGASTLAEAVANFVAGVGSLPAGEATLWISSDPAGATVFVDGTRVGTTGELDLLMLAPGRYQIEVRREGYLPENRNVELRGRDARLITIPLTPASGGSVQAVATPPARLLLSGRDVGRTPLSVPVLPGSYEVRLERAGFEPLVATVPVRSLRVTRIDEVLDPLDPPALYWEPVGGLTVEVDGLPRLEGYAGGLQRGLVSIAVTDASGVRRVQRTIGETDLYRLDLERLELIPVGDPGE